MSVKMPGLTVVVAVVAAMISGCGVANSVGSGVSDPMTPQQSEAQVSQAAAEIVEALDLDVTEAFVSNSACLGAGKSPFQGKVRIGYPKAANFEQSKAEIAHMVQRLKTLGWNSDSYFLSHGIVLEKNNVVASIAPQNGDGQTRTITLYGECRDTTTTKDTAESRPLAFD